MEQFVLTVGDKEYRVCLPTQQALEVEKQLDGKPINEALSPDMAVRIRTQQVLLWAGLQKYQHKMTQAAVLDLMDEMEDGFTMDGVEFPDFCLENRVRLCMRIGLLSGFFPADTKAELLKKALHTEETEETETADPEA